MLSRESERVERPRTDLRSWITPLLLAVLCTGLGLLLALEVGSRRVTPSAVGDESWEFAVLDLIDSNARLRTEIETLQGQLTALEDAEGTATGLQLLVDGINTLRVANGLVEVSGPGVEVAVSGPVSALDLQDLINELRNAGAEALALNGQRLVAWSAISTDGFFIVADGQAVQSPYRFQAIGDDAALQAALERPGGVVSLLRQAEGGPTISVRRTDKLTLPVYSQRIDFVYAKAVQ